MRRYIEERTGQPWAPEEPKTSGRRRR
jgi:hypothetical protein